MNTKEIDKQIKELEKQKLKTISDANKLKRKQNREAFWKDQVFPILGFIFLVCILIQIFGKQPSSEGFIFLSYNIFRQERFLFIPSLPPIACREGIFI